MLQLLEDWAKQGHTSVEEILLNVGQVLRRGRKFPDTDSTVANSIATFEVGQDFWGAQRVAGLREGSSTVELTNRRRPDSCKEFSSRHLGTG